MAGGVVAAELRRAVSGERSGGEWCGGEWREEKEIGDFPLV